MMIVMDRQATVAQVAHVTAFLEQTGCQAQISRDEDQMVIGAIGNVRPFDQAQIEGMEGVVRTLATLAPFKRASRDFHPQDTRVSVGNVTIGGERLAMMGGPCAVESLDQLRAVAEVVRDAGATILRGGAFKPRTSPYSFQGLGKEGLRILDQVRRETGLLVVSEVTEPELVPVVVPFVDILQVGARNMQNYALLQAVGKAQQPVLLKRGMMSTVEELLMAAEYILSQGNGRVILCERGIRTFETYTRNTVDINAVPLIKRLSHLPVVVDPSHGTGRWDLVEPVSLGAIAAGADGLLVEVHTSPETALSDGAQSLRPERFRTLMEKIRPVAEAVGRSL